jgi:hypothetical protein
MTSLDTLAHSDEAYIAGLATSALTSLPASMKSCEIRETLDNLIKQRSQLPDKHPDLTRLDSSIIPLTLIVRSMYPQDNVFSAGPYQLGHEDSPPASRTSISGSSLLQDLKEANLIRELSAFLEVEYLSAAKQDSIWPVEGVLYGPCKRPIVCLPTKLRNKPPKNIFYLVDTGAPITELSPRAFMELGSESTPAGARAFINGSKCLVQLCDPTGNHPDIPLLGADYMTQEGIILTVNYKTQTVTLDRAV